MKPSTHILIECCLGLAFLVLLGITAYDYHQHALDAAKVQANVEGRAQQQKDDDEKLKGIQAERDGLVQQKAESDARYEAAMQKLHNMSPQQIVSEAPNFISGLPRPITIWQNGMTPPVAGDAIVPQEDVNVIAQNVLTGNHCVKDQLPQCVNLLNLANRETKVWNHKFELKDMDAKDWEGLAKGRKWDKFKRCGIIGAANFGLGFGITPTSNNGQSPRFRNGAVLGIGNAALCAFLK